MRSILLALPALAVLALAIIALSGTRSPKEGQPASLPAPSAPEYNPPASPPVSTAPSGAVKLRITRGRGSARLDFGMLTFEMPESVKFKPAVAVLEGDAEFSLSGQLVLEGPANYTVAMPCFAARGLACYRIMVLIPGFDAPMPVAPGSYRATLEVNWDSTGDATLLVELRVAVDESKPQPVPEPQPPNPEGTGN